MRERPRVLLGLDPGLANMGIAVVENDGGTLFVRALRVVRTDATPKKLRTMYLADDNFRRAREIVRALDETIVAWPPLAVAAESFAWVRDASSAAKTAMTWGVIASLCERSGIPLASLGSQDVKKALCGARDASKEDVQKATIARLDWGANVAVIQDFEKATPRTVREHGWDALATAIVALQQSEVIRAAVGTAR
jgi:crossover junction endodeoxyribonuclease RuvC